MSWTYFTDWLEDGDILTYNQWRELVDAAEERMIAVTGKDFAWAGTESPATGMHAILAAAAAGLEVNKLNFTFNSVVKHERLYWLLGSLVDYYAAADDAEETWADSTDIFEQAMTDLGYDTDEGYALYMHDLDGVPSWKVWNIFRRVVQLLRYPIQYASDLTDNNREEDEYHDTYSDFTTALFGLRFTSSSPGSLGTHVYYEGDEPGADDYHGSHYYAEATLNIAAHAIFDNYSLWAFRSTTKSTPPSVSPTFKSTPVSIVIGADIDIVETPTSEAESVKIDLGSALSEQGALDVLVQADATSSTSEYDTFADVGSYSPHENSFAMDINLIVAAPTFTHPYEVIS